jgi:hypothetical protein
MYQPCFLQVLQRTSAMLKQQCQMYQLDRMMPLPPLELCAAAAAAVAAAAGNLPSSPTVLHWGR